MLIPLESSDLSADPRLSDYTRLKDVKLRSALEPERGLYMAESTNVIMRALEIGHRPRSFLMCEKWLPDLAHLIEMSTGAADGGAVPIFVAQEELLKQITGFHLHRGALAAMQRPQLPTVDELIATARHGSPARRIVILEDLVDHTNVGAAFRSAAALGIDAVLVTPRCADPLYRRSVRVSMGTVFQVPWTRIEQWPSLDTLHSAGFTVAALALSDDSISLDEFAVSAACTDPSSRVALVMGTEGDGLSARTITACDTVVRIPMSGGVDSLNVAAASAVAFWATRHVGTQAL
ncbi:TrmH family RNA methyltransferase [Schaalia vaccimaxillae]|uniref:TrmH family RNA methyltransferase n=1 Tax=Schaalia vaccimaxillae TaxID=183916 RepID=UPI0003B48835|nr:RNA methyltransferase [Schaalia vaccimaxillae]